MRVLQLGPYPPPHGGVQSNLVAIREYLRRHGHSAPVINITRHRKPEADEVYYPESAAALTKLIFTLPYDILHLHLGGDLTNRLLALCTVCCSVPGKKKVLTFHSGGYPSSPQGKAANPGTKQGWVLRRFDRLIGVNQEIVDVFHRFGVPPDRTRFIYPHALPGIPSEERLPDGLESFFETHSPVFAAVGLLEPEYDLPLQIRALQALRGQHPDAGLIIIGSGSLHQALEQSIASLPEPMHVLLYGDLAHQHTIQVIRRCDVFLRTTLYDGDSVSVREALHLGTPVVASDNGMRPAGVTLFRIGDLASLLESVNRVLQAGRTGRNNAAADEENVRAVIEVYKELMRRR